MMRRAIITLTAVALLACYAPTLQGMFDQWSSDEDMGHGFVVPIVVLWIVYRERQRWQSLPPQPTSWGLPILALGAAMHFTSALGAGLFAGSVAFLMSLTGAILCLGGFAYLRAWTFPLLLTLFMLPKLAVVYNQATLPLQLLASRMAASILSVAGVGVIREGNILDVAGHRVSVVEACNGIRYLLSLGFMAVVFAYLSDSKAWMRMALLASALPLAILANAIRVAVAASAPPLDSGTPHALLGWFLFVLCLLTLMLLRRVFNEVYTRYYA
jgi:exosortase